MASAVTTVRGNVGFELAGAPDGVRLTDNNNGTFTAFIDVDSGGTYLPTDATSFAINIIDVPSIVRQLIYTVFDVKGNVSQSSVAEPNIGQVDFSLTAASAKVVIDTNQMSQSMQSFITANMEVYSQCLELMLICSGLTLRQAS